MRTICVVLLLMAAGTPASLRAQSDSTSAPVAAPQPHSWQLVQALPPGTKVHIKFHSHAKTDCRVTKVDAETISCDTTAVFKRVDIDSIRTSHRVRSTLIGFGIGYGTAALITGIAAAGNHCENIGCGVVIAVLDLGLLIASPIIGHFTDFTASTIYKVP